MPTTVREVLATHPGPHDVDLDVVARCVEALLRCAQACTTCADACLSEDDPAAMVACIRSDLTVCAVTARVLSRRQDAMAGATRSLLEACLEACRACAAECERHADHHEHCRICAQACRDCVEACQVLVAALD